ncbi:hypothetical protein KP509_10G066700 [Ceratopteris richardii]|uniref:Kinesin light chain n=1 Tax=Ceratopteris richardii TaxID=49495 RepID=A0A8T2U088_CERRI|nr:hypothetical protein KP509_10G066700 [Ceratopteris richardii]KAH7427911.1 hypothetical protein KP509_10G066700 [Ceratopteris richardii]
MDQASRRDGAASAPQSPRRKVDGSLSKYSSKSGRASSYNSSNMSSQQPSANPVKKFAPASLGRSSFRTAPSSPARQQPMSPNSKSSKNKISSNTKSTNDFSPRSAEDASRCSTEKVSRNITLEKWKMSRSSHASQQHRKSNSNESGMTCSDYLPYMEDDALSNASSIDQLGPLFLKLASAMHLSGENPQKALECASRAAKLLERVASGRPNYELMMSLHILAAIHCRLGQWEAAVSVLQRAISVPFVPDNMDHALAAYAGNMQLGDALVMLGQQGSALASYHRAYDIQVRILGDMDPQVAETCSYLAEAHLQALQFEEAADFCNHALLIHREHRKPGSLEEAMDRRLMALILSGKGDYEAALEQLILANAAFAHHSKDADVASVDLTIGEMYVALGKYDEAVFSYQKALSLMKSVFGDGHIRVASVYVSLAEQYLKTGKHREAKANCENALRIYGRQNAGHSEVDLATGLTEIASVYESMNEREQAIMFLQRAHDILEVLPGHQSAVAGIEGQIGVMYYLLGRYEEAFMAFKNVISKLRAAGEGRSSVLAILLNQMGLACIGLGEIWHSAGLFEESKSIFEEILGTIHADTLAIASNLAGAYDALGRSEEAIDLLEKILEVKEERLGTVHPEVEAERHRLMQLLREAGRDRVRKTNTLEELLLLNTKKMQKEHQISSNTA